MRRNLNNLSGLAMLVIFILSTASICQALEPDQIILITNANAPEGVRLAKYYAAQRKIPDQRILQLMVPNGDELSADEFDRDVVLPLKQTLRERGLERKITCMVTFFGVPLRIRARVMQPNDKQEIDALTAEAKAIVVEAEPKVVAIEKLAMEMDSTFRPQFGMTLEKQVVRVRESMAAIGRKIAVMPVDQRQKVERNIWLTFEPVVGLNTMIERKWKQPPEKADWMQYLNSVVIKSTTPVTAPTTAPAVPGNGPTTVPAMDPVAQYMQNYVRVIGYHMDRRFIPESRRILREIVKNNLTVFDYATLLEAQLRYFDTADTQAAFDSELSLLWIDHKKQRWEPNWLNFGNHQKGYSKQIMVMRLDGPTPEIVSRLITNSIKTESEGLTGKIVLDSRGLKLDRAKPDPYAAYDQTIANLNNLIKTRTKLETVFDDKDAVLPVGSATDVALYVGWYSVNEYIPACQFHPGGIGFHLASFTLTSLHHPLPQGWVRGLMLDGADVTLGPVTEPYLQSFPLADELFPLILTGKLSLAECYWRTTPMTSWMITMIGDPLYIPYKKNPALNISDLPPQLQIIFANPENLWQPGLPRQGN